MSRAKHAVILAAGKSVRFFPPLYDRPKGLFEYRGEALIERQIRQLREAGIERITVVVGYEKERFFYLQDRLGVDLAVSTGWADEGSMASLALAREALADGRVRLRRRPLVRESPFAGFEPGGRSVRMVREQGDATRASSWLTRARTAGSPACATALPRALCMVGAAYLSGDFAHKLMDLWDAERGWVSAKALFWEQFWGRHADGLPLYSVPARGLPRSSTRSATSGPTACCTTWTRRPWATSAGCWNANLRMSRRCALSTPGSPTCRSPSPCAGKVRLPPSRRELVGAGGPRRRGRGSAGGIESRHRL